VHLVRVVHDLLDQGGRDEVDALGVAEDEVAGHDRGLPMRTGMLTPLMITLLIALGCTARK